MTTETQRDAPVTLALVLLLVPPFFCQTLLKSTAVQCLSICLAVACLTFRVARGRCRLSIPKPLIAFIGFFALAVLNKNVDIVAGNGLAWFALFGMSLVAVVLLVSLPHAGWIRTALVLIAVFSAFHALVTIATWMVPDLYDRFIYPQFFSDRLTITGRGYRSGFTAHYSTNGIYLALGALASYALAMEHKKKAPYLTLLVLILFALLLTAKRAHLAFGIASIAVSFVAMRGTGGVGKLAVVGAVGILALFAASFIAPDVLFVFDRFSDAMEDDTMNGRTPFYELCMTMWGDDLLLGNGWGSYTQAFNASLLSWSFLARGFETMNAHNVYLQVLAEEGVVGLGLLVAAAVGLFAASMKLAKDREAFRDHASDASIEGALAGSLAIQAFFIMYCLTGNPLYDMQVYIPYLVACSMSLWVYRRRRSEHVGRSQSC